MLIRVTDSPIHSERLAGFLGVLTKHYGDAGNFHDQKILAYACKLVSAAKPEAGKKHRKLKFAEFVPTLGDEEIDHSSLRLVWDQFRGYMKTGKLPCAAKSAA